MNASGEASVTAATLVRLSDTGLTVADPAEDIRGQKVFDKNGQEIGEVDDLMVDDRENKVRFLQVASGGFLGVGETRLLIPVDAIATIQKEGVYVDREREHVGAAPRYDPELADQSYYEGVYGYYGFAPYWGAGYIYPRYPYYV